MEKSQAEKIAFKKEVEKKVNEKKELLKNKVTVNKDWYETRTS